MPIEYGFQAQLKMSSGVAAAANVADILIANVPSVVKVHSAHATNDRAGTDWWAETATGKMLSVDAKIRKQDYAAAGKDDLALETWSVVERQVIGWTRDPSKKTDYVFWLWTDSRRWCLIPFLYLCRVFSDRWQEWLRAYQSAQQFTPRGDGGYHSECVFVPRRVVWREIYKTFSGTPG